MENDKNIETQSNENLRNILKILWGNINFVIWLVQKDEY